MLVDFCLPIKNEELILKNSLDKLLFYCRQAKFSFSWRIVGLINGSTDYSRSILESYRDLFSNEIDFIEVAEPGRGRALKQYWSNSKADIFVYMDADLAVSLDNISDLVYPLVENKKDLSIGSRLIAGAAIKRSLGREFVSRVYNYLSQALLNPGVRDLQCGFKAVRRETFFKIKPHLVDDYWFFDTELIVLSRIFKQRILEVPVDWQENRFVTRPSTVKLFRDSFIFLRNLLFFWWRLRKIKKHPDSV